MYTHMQHTGARIFDLSQILLKIQRFEIGEMEVEHPVNWFAPHIQDVDHVEDM